MMKLKILFFLFAFNVFSANSVEHRIVTEINAGKIVNGDSGLEFLIKGTSRISDEVDLKYGLSEGFVNQRMRALSLAPNHEGTQVDIGVCWKLYKDYQVCYTHSERKYFGDYTPSNYFNYDSRDTLSLRIETNIN